MYYHLYQKHKIPILLTIKTEDTQVSVNITIWKRNYKLNKHFYHVAVLFFKGILYLCSHFK